MSQYRWWTGVVSVCALALSSPSLRAQHTSGDPPPFTTRVVGRGTPIILIPGLTNNGAVWDGTVAELSKTHECHVLSLAGFAGTAPVATDSLWLERMRDAIIDYARTRKLDKPVLIGHSLGGFLALDIAATAPELPSRVINVDGLPFIGGVMMQTMTAEQMRPMAAQMRTMMQRATPEQSAAALEQNLRSMVRDTTAIPLLRTMGRTSDPRTVGEAMYELYTTDLRAKLARITVPVLNLHAWAAYKPMGQTRVRFDSVLTRQYATLRTGTTRVTDTSYHFIMFDEPVWFLAQVREALGQAGPAGGARR
ncbi:MAG: alpha/beta hydrolase [Gemmatimonadaceae bacterium]|jgi:pimeloyl-ACP methyl ester carboxylesterase|nr:alpha/beta hydrolase [Gemmatimonadaceae bacterium]